jgi:hypothetical protein
MKWWVSKSIPIDYPLVEVSGEHFDNLSPRMEAPWPLYVDADLRVWPKPQIPGEVWKIDQVAD